MLFRQAYQFGITHIIIQWSSYNNLLFYPAIDEPPNLVLFNVITAAQKEHLTITMGLSFDQQFWQALTSSDTELQSYLDEHYQQQQFSS